MSWHYTTCSSLSRSQVYIVCPSSASTFRAASRLYCQQIDPDYILDLQNRKERAASRTEQGARSATAEGAGIKNGTPRTRATAHDDLSNDMQTLDENLGQSRAPDQPQQRRAGIKNGTPRTRATAHDDLSNDMQTLDENLGSVHNLLRQLRVAAAVWLLPPWAGACAVPLRCVCQQNMVMILAPECHCVKQPTNIFVLSEEIPGKSVSDLFRPHKESF